MQTYIMSDIHGQIEAFELMLKKIKFNERKDKIYLLGDYVDGQGQSGCKLLLRLIELSKKGCLYPILGNHDDMMLSAVKLQQINPQISLYSLIENNQSAKDIHKIECWEYNGGYYTFGEYLRLSKDNQLEILKFLESLPVCRQIECNGTKYYLAHAGIGKSRHECIWGGPYEHYIRFLHQLDDTWMAQHPDTTLITGHRITARYKDAVKSEDGAKIIKPKIIKIEDKRRILVDCGCKAIQFKDGYGLGCLRLEDMRETYVRNGEIIHELATPTGKP